MPNDYVWAQWTGATYTPSPLYTTASTNTTGPYLYGATSAAYRPVAPDSDPYPPTGDYLAECDCGSCRRTRLAIEAWEVRNGRRPAPTRTRTPRWAAEAQMRARAARLSRSRLEDARYEAQRQRERDEERAAEVRARALLESILTPEQANDLNQSGAFVVETPRRTYRIRTGSVGNVDVLRDLDWTPRPDRCDCDACQRHGAGYDPDTGRMANGERLYALCCHPAGPLVNYDTMAAQALWITHHEAEFLEEANVL